MRKRIPLALIVCLLWFTPSGATQIIQWNEAQNYYGQYVTVQGKIVATYNSGRACFLNFHPNYKKYFTAVIFKSDFHLFPPNPEDYYSGKEVQVTGRIKQYKGKPEVILKNPDQIKIIKASVETQTEGKIISWKEANKYYGKVVTVEGTVVATYNSGKACFLNFHRNWKRYFTGVIFASSFHKFPSAPEDLYRNKKVGITGLIKEYHGKPEIIIKSPVQIIIVE